MAIVVGPTQWQDLARIRGAALGSSICGGYVICKSGGTAWIVAPASTEVSRNWYVRSNAVTTANANAACGDWFVPTHAQLQNPGYTCRTYWDSYSSACYWSNSVCSAPYAWAVNFTNGSSIGPNYDVINCIRAFRCVTY